MVKANGIDIWTEDFGDRVNPTILLIMGATAQGIRWEEEFCEMLAGRARHVIRYDNRDVGQSTAFDYEKNPYTLHDMAEDAVGVLDAYEVAAAHIVGASLGGAIAQYLALDHRGRVRTLTLIFTGPAVRELTLAVTGQEVDCDLPMPRSPDMLKLAQEQLDNPQTTREEYLEFVLKFSDVLAGSRFPQNRERSRALMGREYDRAHNWKARTNHALAGINSDPDLRPRLRHLDVATLVIHGTDDPIMPFEHGEALANTIQGAKLIPIEAYGHQFHPDIYPMWVDAIDAHTN